MRLPISVSALAFAFAVSAAGAQSYYVTGEITLPNWQPGTAEPLGGGTAADLELTEEAPGLLSATLPQNLHLLTQDQEWLWEAALPGFAGSLPRGNAANHIHGPVEGDLTFYAQTMPENDGFIPDAGDLSGNNGFIWTSQTIVTVQRAESVQATGGFQNAIEPGTEWNPSADSAVTLTDDNEDGFYVGTVTGLPSGSYEFKVTLNGAFDPFVENEFFVFGNSGLGGDNFSFTVIEDTDTITITLDGVRGRVRVENDNPAASPGPPFFAVSGAWGTSYTEDTQLFDLGDGLVYGRAFTVPEAGNYIVSVQQFQGRNFPNTGQGYSFTTNEDDQMVAVIFDRTPYDDTHYTPYEDFVVVLDHATRAPLNEWERVQPVGNWQDDVGSSEWNENDPALNASETSLAGLYSIALAELEGNSQTDAQLKAVGVPLADWSEQGWGSPWDTQFGGPLDGFTFDGNNGVSLMSYDADEEFTIFIDTVTGRVGKAQLPTKDTDGAPARGEYFDPAFDIPADDTRVESWEMLQ